jgi:hypothetical protein
MNKTMEGERHPMNTKHVLIFALVIFAVISIIVGCSSIPLETSQLQERLAVSATLTDDTLFESNPSKEASPTATLEPTLTQPPSTATLEPTPTATPEGYREYVYSEYTIDSIRSKDGVELLPMASRIDTLIDVYGHTWEVPLNITFGVPYAQYNGQDYYVAESDMSFPIYIEDPSNWERQLFVTFVMKPENGTYVNFDLLQTKIGFSLEDLRCWQSMQLQTSSNNIVIWEVDPGINNYVIYDHDYFGHVRTLTLYTGSGLCYEEWIKTQE